jgi:site-specific recombinase XerD
LVVILGRLFLPKEITMFEQLFPHQATVARYRQSPFAAERELYLSRLMQDGRSLQTLRNIAWILMYLARHLPLHQAEITPPEIEAAAAEWAMTTHRSSTCLRIGMREFVFHATNWMRLLGRLREPEVKRPFAAETDAFLQFAVNERGLSPSTVRHYRVCVGEFLCWVEQQKKAVREVTLEDLSSYFRVLAQRGLKRTSIALHVAKLRNFLRFAESRHWCKSGLSILDAPRIYRLESLPRGPAWSDVQKLLTSCAGDRPIEIRDHAMLLLIAVYGLRSGEVRHLRLEDIDWEREIINIRRAKQRKSQSYPLVQEVGAAILRYLRSVRPRCQRREVFISAKQPYRALSAGGLGVMVQKRMRRLGIASVCYGPHALRHSCATHLLAEGVSLKEIADHLGHVSLAATQMYAKVDMLALREVGKLPIKVLVKYAEESERSATPILPRGSMEALRTVATLSLGGLA